MAVYDDELDRAWQSPPAATRDWKKIFLMIGLGALSWAATYVGMLELIESNLGSLPFTQKLIIAIAVAMLMTMIIWLLDQLFAPIPAFTKFIYGLGYIFLTMISVGFGFGFYWKVLESRSETTRSAASAVTQVQGALVAASARLDQLQTTLTDLTVISKRKAQQERDFGTSCPNSRPGDGPRRRLRDNDAAQFSFASSFVAGRAAKIRTELKSFDASLALVTKASTKTLDAKTGTRNTFMRQLNGKLDRTVARYNAFRTDPQLRQIRANLSERADKTIFPSHSGRTFSCPDVQLQTALRGVVRAIDQLPGIDRPKIKAVEGSEATIEAFRRLGVTFYGLLSLRLPPSADELRTKRKRAVLTLTKNPNSTKAKRLRDAQSGLSQRDYIPLAIAIFVDLCLLLVAMGRPMNRLHGLVPRMVAAEQGPIYQILSKFSDIHKDDEVREKFEVFRHVVFDFNGDYYVAVPLDAPYGPGGPYQGQAYATEDVQALQQEAHLLANLFASFEKERVFSRVYSPFLTTRTIQKKLTRQGSKFATSRAFRIYRFKDGAWSEIILGAIMGAARRVEAAKRQNRLEEGPKLVHTAPDTESPPVRAFGFRPRHDQGMVLSGLETPANSDWSAVKSPRPNTTGFTTARPEPGPKPDLTAHAPASQDAPLADVDVRPAQFGRYAGPAAREFAEVASKTPAPFPDPDHGEAGQSRQAGHNLVSALRRAQGAHAQQDNAVPDTPADDDNVLPFEPSRQGELLNEQSELLGDEEMPRILTGGRPPQEGDDTVISRSDANSEETMDNGDQQPVREAQMTQNDQNAFRKSDKGEDDDQTLQTEDSGEADQQTRRRED